MHLGDSSWVNQPSITLQSERTPFSLKSYLLIIEVFDHAFNEYLLL